MMKTQALQLQLLLVCLQVVGLLAAEQVASLFSRIRPPTSRFMNFGSIVRLDTFLPPMKLSDLSTQFSVYTRTAQVEDITFEDQPIPFDIEQVRGAQVNASARTVVAIPGYLTGDRIRWLDELASKWRRLDGDVNVVTVSWKAGNRFIYSTAVANTPMVARQITVFLAYLAEAAGTSLDDDHFVGRIQLVGHSLGAHIAGYVGQDLQARVGRIVGLDPAGPSFDQMPAELRLDEGDARLVQVLHTNSGKLKYRNALAVAPVRALDMLAQRLPIIGQVREALASGFAGECDTTWFGIDLQLGHLDYYANGGRTQPGCEGILHTCDHGRAHNLYLALLERQIQLTSALGAERALAATPLAFYADNYAQFLHEAAVQTRCFETGQNVTSDNCSVAVDLVGPPEAVRVEPSKKQKLFFQTNGDEPLVGDQYLLQIQLSNDLNWDDSCALELYFNFADDQAKVVVNKWLSATPSNQLAIPFVGRLNYAALERTASQARTQTSSAAGSTLSQALPGAISMRISSSKSTGIGEATMRKAARLLSLGLYKPKPSESCRLEVKSVEIRALVGGLGRPIVGVYTGNSTELRVLSSGRNKTNPPELVLEPKTNEHAIRYLADVIVG